MRRSLRLNARHKAGALYRTRRSRTERAFVSEACAANRNEQRRTTTERKHIQHRAKPSQDRRYEASGSNGSTNEIAGQYSAPPETILTTCRGCDRGRLTAWHAFSGVVHKKKKRKDAWHRRRRGQAKT